MLHKINKNISVRYTTIQEKVLVVIMYG